MSMDEAAHAEGVGVGEETLTRSALLGRVRAWLEIRLRDSSLRDLAKEIGVGKSSIDKLVAGQVDPGKTWPRLRAWYLADRQARRAPLHDPASMAILFLAALDHIPAARRAEAIRSTVQHLRGLHRDAEAPEPEWLGVLAGWAEEGMSIHAGGACNPREEAAAPAGWGLSGPWERSWTGCPAGRDFRGSRPSTLDPGCAWLPIFLPGIQRSPPGPSPGRARAVPAGGKRHWSNDLALLYGA